MILILSSQVTMWVRVKKKSQTSKVISHRTGPHTMHHSLDVAKGTFAVAQHHVERIICPPGLDIARRPYMEAIWVSIFLLALVVQSGIDRVRITILTGNYIRAVGNVANKSATKSLFEINRTD